MNVFVIMDVETLFLFGDYLPVSGVVSVFTLIVTEAGEVMRGILIIHALH